MNNIIEDNQNLIYKIASRYKNYYNIEDLFQVGVIGLLNAYNNYDDKSNAKFSTYAYSYIFGEIMEFIRNDRCIKIGSDNLKIFKAYTKAKDYLTQSLEKEPSIEEVSEFLGMEEYDVSNAIIGSEYMLSMDIEDDTTHELSYVDERERVDASIQIEEGLSNLNHIDREILRCRYYEDYTQSEIASLLGISQVQVSRYEAKALVKMKNQLI